MEPKSKEYSWKYVTADELLSLQPCELIYARLTSAPAAGRAILYNGENATGRKILELATAGLYNSELSPPVPIYCSRGLFVGSVTTVDCVLVIWRVIPQGIGYEH